MLSILKEYQSLSIEWQQAIENHFNLVQLKRLDQFISDERSNGQIYPPEGEVLTALRLCTLQETRVVILGQDPYHGPQQAHGLSFSINAAVAKLPPSLRNIYKERATDLQLKPRKNGDLSDWASQGVLLLNTVLTVRHGDAHSHKNKGWEDFTNAIIHAVSNFAPHAVFILWGRPAQKKKSYIDQRHTIIESVHPSPLSASRGFWGSMPFSKTNLALRKHQQMAIKW